MHADTRWAGIVNGDCTKPIASIANANINGILYTMPETIPIDKAGRVVLPKAIRDKLHLSDGVRLRVEVVGDRIELTPEPDEVVIVKKGKRRVISGWEGFDAAKAVNEAREAQVQRDESASNS